MAVYCRNLYTKPSGDAVVFHGLLLLLTETEEIKIEWQYQRGVMRSPHIDTSTQYLNDGLI